MAAAQESSADAILRSGHIGPDVLPELVQHVMQVARGYDTESRMAAFRHARTTRDLAVSLTRATQRPTELADLYGAAGQANALMASLAFDLGRWDASAPMARAATTYAALAGHHSLGAWTLGLEATLAFWRGDGDGALERIAAGLAIAPAGKPRFRLLHIAARAHAVRGDRASVVRAIDDARAERDEAAYRVDDLHHGVGGEFRFDDARANACAGAAWLRLSDGAEAATCARLTIELARLDPTPASPGIVCGARIDLASALLLAGELDEAGAHLAPVLGRQPDRGNVSLGGRLATARGLLVADPWASDHAAVQLADQITEWLAGAGIPVQQGK